MSVPSGVSSTSAAGSRRVRAALVAGALVIIALGGLYWSYVQRRTEYLVNRDLRLLSIAAAQIDANLESRKQIVRNFLETQNWCDGDKPIDSYPSNAADVLNLAPYLANFTDLQRGTAVKLADAVPESACEGGYCVTQENAAIRIEYYAAPAPHNSPDTGGCPPDVGYPRAVGRTSLDSLVTPVLEKPLFGVFDTVLIATSSGEVVKQIQPHGAQGRRSVSSRDGHPTAGQDAPSSLVLATLKSIVDRSSKDGKPIDLDTLRNETRSSDVEISGVRYFLLTQPYSFAAPSGGGRGAQHWIIAGLVARPHFMRDATEISMSLIELVVAGLILLVCCWPFMKLAFSGPGEPVTRADVVMGGVATLLGGGMVALFFADVFAYGRIESTGDFQQRAFAAVMHEDMQKGIEQIVRIGGRMRELTVPYAIAYESSGKTHSEGDFKTRLPWDLTQPYAYGFFSGAAWVNDRGEQVVQVAMKQEQGPPPLPSVARRQYFHALRDGKNAHPWTWVNPFDPKHPSTEFVIESVRTLATGASEAVMAFPVRGKALPDLHVFTVAFPFVEVGSHVGSPDLTYSIIDQNGDVVFGSESDRNGIENVFTETDQDRKLRAAVNARQEDFVDTTYWGEDVRVLVTPIENLPWTLLTFRDKRLLRTMNLDTLMMTIILFLFYLGAIVLIVVAVLLVRPSYRVPWVWPIEQRLPHWRRVRLMYIVSGIAFVVAVFALSPASRLAVACLVPFYAFLGTYLVLSDGPKRLAYGLSVFTWTAITAVFAWGCVKAPVASEVVGPVAEGVSLRALMLLCLLVAFLCVVVRAEELNRVRWREFSRTYIACGVLFITLVAILPMIACFQAALTIESEALVKSGQRRMVDLFLQRIETLAQNSWCDTTNVLAGYPIPFFYESHWCIQVDSLDKESPAPCGYDSSARISKLASTVKFRPAEDKVGDFLEEYLPVYSEDSLDMRGLHSGKGDDGSWQTVRARRVLALSRKFDLSDAAQSKLLAQFRAPFSGHLAPALLQLVEPIGEKRAWLTIVSRVPSLLPDWLRADDPIRLFPQKPVQLVPGELTPFPGPPKDPEVPGPVLALFFLFAAGVAFSVVRWSVRFAARRIVLYDLREPRWLDTPLRPPLGEHVFLVHTPDNLSKLIHMADVERRSFDDLREIELSSDDDSWRPPAKSADWLALVDSGTKRAILCEGLGDGLSDVALTKRKFALIESMMQLTDCTLIISSPVSPALFLSLYDDLDPATRARWAAVLSMFVWIDETRLLNRGRAFAAADSPISSVWERTKTAWRTFKRVPQRPKRLQTRKPSSLCMRWLRLWKWCLQFTAKGREERDRADDQSWITRETEPSTFLKSFADRLRSLPGGREQMLDELRERADRYYHALWKMCSPSERMVLYHVAHFGVANCNNRRQIRRLLARGLLRRDGELRLFNTTFRLFVLAHGDEIREQYENEPEGRSTFDRVRVPLFIGILVVLGALIGTQKELANATSAILTALATGLPMIVNLVGTFTDRRVGTVER